MKASISTEILAMINLPEQNKKPDLNFYRQRPVCSQSPGYSWQPHALAGGG